MIYLYLLLTEASLPLLKDKARFQAMSKQIELSYRQSLREEVELLGGQVVSGELPAYPNEYVVATCLMFCKNKNIDFNSNRDEISYSVDTLEGTLIGTCKITIERNSTNSESPSNQAFSGLHSQLPHPSSAKISVKSKPLTLTRGQKIGLSVIAAILALIAIVVFVSFGINFYTILLGLAVTFLDVRLIMGTIKAQTKSETHKVAAGQTGKVVVAGEQREQTKLTERVETKSKQDLCMICGKGTRGTVTTSFLCMDCGYNGTLHQACVEARRQGLLGAYGIRSVPSALTFGAVGIRCPKCGATA